MGLLSKKYRLLEPTKEYLGCKVVLAQAWKKAHQYIRSTNWYADTFELDRSAIDLDSKLDSWLADLHGDEFKFEALRIVPAPKSQRWYFKKRDTQEMWGKSSHKWCPMPSKENEKDQPLRPLAHVSIRDQSLLMALMMCLANRVESAQGNTAIPLSDVHKKKIVNYGNRLYCQYKDEEANFSWGSSTSYSKYFTDYQFFLARPIYFGGEALQKKIRSQKVYEVHLDIEKFYDCIDRERLTNKINELCSGNADPLLSKLLKSFREWEWGSGSPEIYNLVCKKGDEPIPRGIPQGLVIGGFLANIYLLDFDKEIQSLIGVEIESGLQLVDYCRYVDDMRLIIVASLGKDIDDIRNLINSIFLKRLSDIGLKFGNEKTKIELFRYKRSGISTKLHDIQKKVSGPLSAGEIDEQLGSLEGLLGLAEGLRISEKDLENTNSLALIDSPSNDVRDDTLLRFSANKIHKLLKQKRSLVAQEVDVNGIPKPGVWDYLQERMARKFISCWSKDPSLVQILKKGFELFPDPRILNPVLEQLKDVLERKEAPIQQKIAEYCLGEIFRDAATVVHSKEEWSFPAQTDISGFFECLQVVAIEIIMNPEKYTENILSQAMFYCLVRNDSPLDHSSNSEYFNIITKIMNGNRNISVISGGIRVGAELKLSSADFIVNSLLAYQMAFNKSLVVRSVSSILEKIAVRYPVIPSMGMFPIPKEGLFSSDVLPFCRRIAVECPVFFTELFNDSKVKRPKWLVLCGDLIDKIGLLQPVLDGELARHNKKYLSLLPVIKRSDNPFAHENAALALLFAVLNDGKFQSNFEFSQNIDGEEFKYIDISNCKISCENWDKIQSLSVGISIEIKEDDNPIIRVPDWVNSDHSNLYGLGMFLRGCLIGNVDWTAVRGGLVQSKYMGLKSSLMKRQIGMMHSPEALNGETAPMSNWVSCLLSHLLQWPGANVHSGCYEWPDVWNIKSLKKIIKDRLVYQRALFCEMIGVPAYVEKLNLNWPLDKKTLKVMMVQSLLPLKADFRECGLMLDTPAYRARHRRHVASVAELVLHKSYSQRSIDDINYKDGRLDLIIWPELSVNNEDIDILKQLADKTGAIIYVGLTFLKLSGIDGPVNVAKWLIPQKMTSGRNFISRLQGKKNMMKDEAGKVRPWRPYQLLIELVHPAFPKDKGFRLTGSICYDATDVKISADLKDKSDAYLVVALNQDVNTFDSMVDALYYNMYQHVVLVNTGEFGGSVAKAPYKERHEKLISHVHGSHQVSISSFEMNMFDFRQIGASYRSGKLLKTQPAG